MAKSTTKRTKTIGAINSFKKWNKERTPISNKDGKVYKFTKKERIVPLYDYLLHKLNKRYYVTEKGVILSFVEGKPLALSPTPDKGYLKFSTSESTLNVHRAVWFSFAYDSLTNGSEFPLTYQITVETIKDLKKITSEIEVNHIDENRKNNKLSNLRLMDKVYNILLRDLFNDDMTEENKFKKFVEISKLMPQDSPTIIKDGDIDNKGKIDYRPQPQPTVLELKNYYVFYMGNLFIHSILANKVFRKAIEQHISKTDAEEHMKENTYYPLTIHDNGTPLFKIWVTKK